MPGVTDIWKVALQDGYCVQLFRDEVIMFHKEFQNLLDGMKGWVSERRKVHSWFCVLSRESQESDQNQFSPNIIIVNTYYLAESVSGQNEVNPVFWLASWAQYLARFGFPTLVPQKMLSFCPFNKSFIDQACSIMMAVYWPRSLLHFYWPRRKRKKELGQYPAILTSCWVNNTYIIQRKG